MDTQIFHERFEAGELGDIGLFRYRITFQDSSFLEMFERFQSVGGELKENLDYNV